MYDDNISNKDNQALIYDAQMQSYMDTLRHYIKTRYGKTYDDLCKGVKNNVCVSLTSYKERMKNVYSVIESICNQTTAPLHICLTLFNEDLEYIPPKLQDLIDRDVVELIVSDIDIRPHKKYFYVM